MGEGSGAVTNRFLSVHDPSGKPWTSRAQSTSGKVTSEMLLPAKAEVALHLERYRAWERLLLAAPADHTVRGKFENTAYTLCVLMGERCAREAADAAERYLRPHTAAKALHHMSGRPHGGASKQSRGVSPALGG